jgi:hypothetical protein
MLVRTGTLLSSVKALSLFTPSEGIANFVWLEQKVVN